MEEIEPKKEKSVSGQMFFTIALTVVAILLAIFIYQKMSYAAKVDELLELVNTSKHMLVKTCEVCKLFTQIPLS